MALARRTLHHVLLAATFRRPRRNPPVSCASSAMPGSGVCPATRVAPTARPARTAPPWAAQARPRARNASQEHTPTSAPQLAPCAMRARTQARWRRRHRHSASHVLLGSTPLRSAPPAARPASAAALLRIRFRAQTRAISALPAHTRAAWAERRQRRVCSARQARTPARWAPPAA